MNSKLRVSRELKRDKKYLFKEKRIIMIVLSLISIIVFSYILIEIINYIHVITP